MSVASPFALSPGLTDPWVFLTASWWCSAIIRDGGCSG